MEHNLWNYIYYFVYLKNKQRKNLNAIEGMIIEHWEANQIDWLPDSFLWASLSYILVYNFIDDRKLSFKASPRETNYKWTV